MECGRLEVRVEALALVGAMELPLLLELLVSQEFPLAVALSLPARPVLEASNLQEAVRVMFDL